MPCIADFCEKRFSEVAFIITRHIQLFQLQITLKNAVRCLFLTGIDGVFAFMTDYFEDISRKLQNGDKFFYKNIVEKICNRFVIICNRFVIDFPFAA